jgi:hypothetical protein
MAATVVLIVAIRPLGWRLLATIPMWLAGVALLIMSTDELDQQWSGRGFRGAGEVLQWLSASVFGLAVAVVLGAFVPSLLRTSNTPSFASALGCDALIGAATGALTLGLVALNGWLGGWLASRVRRIPGLGHEEPDRLRLPLRDEWSALDVARMLGLPLAGVLVSALFTQLAVGGPSRTSGAGADSAPSATPVAGSLALPLAVWFLTTGVLWWGSGRVWRARRHVAPRPAHSRRRRATHASALGVVLAILIGWGSAGILNRMIEGSLRSHGTVTGVSIQSVPAGQQVDYLAQRFAPEFVLAPHEAWDPTTVDWYVAHSRIDTTAPYCVPSPQGEAMGCRALCSITAGPNCAPLCDLPSPAACAPVGGDPPAVYYRYRDAANTPADPAAPARHDWAVFEYWIFYNYDSLSAGLVTQWHQSDWEQVSVLVERHGLTVDPVEVGFSEHCYGAAVPATEVSWSGTHPISYVGRGSHANYPTPTDPPIRQLQCLDRHVPSYLGAAGLFFNAQIAGWSLELPVAYLIGLRDATGHGRRISGVRAIAQAATPSLWSFHGYWGISNDLRIGVAGGFQSGAGPQSPQDQTPSRKPFSGMFCRASWLRISPTRATAWVCSASR